MKTFRFLCKQNQSKDVCEVLKEHGYSPYVSLYHGPRGEGVMVECLCKSKTKVDRLLHEYGVLGARSRKKPGLVVNLDKVCRPTGSDLYNKCAGKRLTVVYNGKMYRANVSLRRPACTCCGPEYVVELPNGRDIYLGF